MGLARRDRGRLGLGGEGRVAVFFLNVLHQPDYLPRKARGGAEGQMQASTLSRHWRAPPPLPYAEKKQNQLSPDLGTDTTQGNAVR